MKHIIFKNKRLRLEPTLLYRTSKITDRDINNKAVKPSYKVLVYSKDVHYEILNDGLWVADVDQAKQSNIKLNHNGNNYGHTKWQKRKTKKGILIDGKLVHEYMQSTLYLMQDKKVYKGSVKRKIRSSEI